MTLKTVTDTIRKLLAIAEDPSASPHEREVAANVSGVDEPFSRPNALDLGIDPCLRVQSLLTNLGGVAKNWPASLTINAGTKDATETRQALTLAALACDAVCTAVAAERGLWQAES